MRKKNSDNQRKLIPEEEKLSSELKQFGLSDQIVNVLLAEKDKPEGAVRIAWVKRLIQEYGFPSANLDINVAAGVGRDAGKENIPVRADIVVYRDPNKTMAFVVVETKAPDEKTGVAQAESYARNLGAEYHLWSNGTDTRYFKTSRYPNLSEPIAYLPVWVTDKPQIKKVPKTKQHQLRPFKDEEELRHVIKYCHDLILEKLGHDPAKAFDEMSKLLFLKLYDEREVPNYYEFVVLSNESPHDVGDKIRKLFDKAISSSKYHDVFWSQFNTKPVPVTLELDDLTIFNIVQKLQGYSLIHTTENIQGADIKGVVYEQMVGTTFRGELAQFFTPRELVDFIVEVIKPDRESKVLDPACGSGGFLIMVLRKLRKWIKEENPNLDEGDVKAEIKYSAEHKMFGIDINDRMVRVAKMNMIMHGDGHAGIYHILRGGGLLTDPNLPDRLKEELKDGTLDVIFSNPPFAGREKDPKILERFELGKNEKGDPVTVSKEVLFVEKIIRLLKDGGKAGLVLPAGVFNNPNSTMVRLRRMLKTQTKILALVALPHLAFQVTGANNEGNLIFIEKTKPPSDYEIYIDWARYVGIDSTGKKIPQNDLLEIKERMKNPPKRNLIRLSELEDRIDPWYYHPRYAEIKAHLAKSPYPLVPISELVQESDDLFDPQEHPMDDFDYIETNDVDLDEGVIISSRQITGKSAPSRAKYVLKDGDVLIPNARDCIRGVTVISKEHEGWIGSNRFLVVRPRKDKVDPSYLYNILRQPETLALLKQQATGEINPGISIEALEMIKVPVPSDLHVQQDLVKQIEKEEEAKATIIKQLEQHETSISKIVRGGLPPLGMRRERLRKLGYDYIGDL